MIAIGPGCHDAQRSPQFPILRCHAQRVRVHNVGKGFVVIVKLLYKHSLCSESDECQCDQLYLPQSHRQSHFPGNALNAEGEA